MPELAPVTRHLVLESIVVVMMIWYHWSKRKCYDGRGAWVILKDSEDDVLNEQEQLMENMAGNIRSTLAPLKNTSTNNKWPHKTHALRVALH
jgi:hypothetical protein